MADFEYAVGPTGWGWEGEAAPRRKLGTMKASRSAARTAAPVRTLRRSALTQSPAPWWRTPRTCRVPADSRRARRADGRTRHALRGTPGRGGPAVAAG